MHRLDQPQPALFIKKEKNQPQPAGYVHEVRWFYRRIRSWCLSSSDLSHVSGCQAPADAEVSWSQAMVFQVIPIRFGALVSGPFKGSDGSWVVVFWGFFNSCKCNVTFRWHDQAGWGDKKYSHYTREHTRKWTCAIPKRQPLLAQAAGIHSVRLQTVNSSQTKSAPVTSTNLPPVLFSHNKSAPATSHQPQPAE